MKLLQRIFGQKMERRSNFTDMALALRYETISGRRGMGELTGTVQGCVNLWAGGLSLAEGHPLLTPDVMTLAARSLALRGEALFLIGDTLIPISEYEVSTRNAKPTAYRVTVPDTGGGTSDTVLAGEVIHFRIGADMMVPWAGVSPLQRSSLSAGMLHALEDSLADVYSIAPIGSQIAPMPEQQEVDQERLARSFRGQRGRVLLRESVNVSAAGGPAPVTDWRPSSLSPDISKSMTDKSLAAARDSICHAYGVLPSMLDPGAAGPLVREATRHLAQWTLQPIAKGMAAECSMKLGESVQLDVLEPLQAYDSGNRARALMGVIQGLALAKEAGLSAEQVKMALDFSGVE